MTIHLNALPASVLDDEEFAYVKTTPVYLDMLRNQIMIMPENECDEDEWKELYSCIEEWCVDNCRKLVYPRAYDPKRRLYVVYFEDQAEAAGFRLYWHNRLESV